MDEKNVFAEKILIGAIAMVLLLFLMAPALFYGWILSGFLSKAVAFFFIIPLAYAIINLKAPKEIIVVIGVGGLLFVFYAYLFFLTFQEGVELILQSVVDIIFITVLIQLSRRWMEKKLPP